MGYDEIISTFGEPNSVYDSNYSSYYEMNYGEAYASDNSDWMIFGLYFEEQNVITAIHASPGLFSFNGQNLRQDYNSLKRIFGEQLELGTTSMYNSESVLYYGDYVYTINYPISPDEWDENALPTDIYVQLSSQSIYNQNADNNTTISAGNSYEFDSICSLLGTSVESIMDDWGTPLEYEAGSGVNYCTYDGITFNFDADGTIFTIDLAPSKCVINAETLGKSHDTLLDILGAPTEEGWVPGGYTDVYHMLYENWGNGVEFYIEFITLDETASNMRIWQN